ncbi:T6SS phospholipase effector Tle1-like catalytic domain-containing protein [Roseateles koreensis]|uniref:DUF2235 domain-containing protein n=1 Tax=Roseateles koreensis TaxID=2987526 RepID=A0ABT5KZX2_9BURK|nr:DUF2235 domain-containing protein [Roseateles koreensis]MDC8787282.1 DUF2235 domain-containing protein [Roseateles koreensis]
MSITPLTTQSTCLRPLDKAEFMQRACGLGLDQGCVYKCQVPIWVNFFFDGTNNNLYRDQPKKSHSNVGVLFNTSRDNQDEGYFAHYIPGVGTPFPDIGEYGELPEGKSQGAGGDARINWALFQLLNDVHWISHKALLFKEDEARKISTQAPMCADVLHNGVLGEAGNNLQGKRTYFSNILVPRLQKALVGEEGRRRLPEVVHVNVAVFGFSRGAAEARAFCFYLDHLLDKGQLLAGIKVEVQFLGLFDTVASVGVADASPYIPFRGFGAWANGTLDIPTPLVKRSVHFVAAHEIRKAFPLSSARMGKTAYPPHCTEVVYPGAHSDVGGGYAPGEQGKALRDRSRLLSQVPLVNMYLEAMKAGVALLSADQLIKAGAAGARTVADLDIHPDTSRLFEAYAKAQWKSADVVEEHLKAQMQMYWRWRANVTRRRASNAKVQPPLAGLTTLKSYEAASPQERLDLMGSEKDFVADTVAFDSSPGQDRAARSAYLSTAARGVVSPEVDEFFDTLMHDSHASFYMVGPVTEQDKRDKVAQVAAKGQRVAEAQAVWDRWNSRPKVGAANPPVPEPLSPLEQRILAHQKEHPGEFPPVSDAETADLLALESLTTRMAVKTVAGTTRREEGGHIRYRKVFDTST